MSGAASRLAFCRRMTHVKAESHPQPSSRVSSGTHVRVSCRSLNSFAAASGYVGVSVRFVSDEGEDDKGLGLASLASAGRGRGYHWGKPMIGSVGKRPDKARELPRGFCGCSACI